jgi:flavin reductase (DIM6/NTAB) family NADH-FMN oxidoreductase RutF
MIDPAIKRYLGQAMHGVQVVGASHNGLTRAYTSHWVMQVSFEEPLVMASISPKHDTYPLLVESGRFSVSILAGDQVAEGQYFSYPGRKFHYLADEYLEEVDGLPIVRNCIAWYIVNVEQRMSIGDHDLVIGRVSTVGGSRLKDPPLLYSSRLGWRISGEKAREPGTSIRDVLLERLAASGLGTDSSDDGDVVD